MLDYKMNYILSTIPELIKAESSLRKKKKHVMLMDSSDSNKISKNEKRSKSNQVEGDMAEKKAKETGPKRACFHYGKDGNLKMN